MLAGVALFGTAAYFFLRSGKGIDLGGTQTIEADVLVYGSSLGGISTALELADANRTVVLVAENAIIGGQAVESGISAFDDMDNPWEDTGLYAELIDYLQSKYHNGQAGLGAAAVGRVASPAQDIQEFLLDQIARRPTITLLRNYRFIEANKKKDVYESVIVEEQETGQRMRVRFSYLVSASQTGLLLQELEEPFAVGFDTAEETKEPSALPAAVREAFVQGAKGAGQQIFPGWGNRVQSVSAPFVLLDKGYAGDFFPIDQFPDQSCWHTANVTSFMIGTSARSGRTGCTAQVTPRPGARDTYDIFFINHGMKTFEVGMRWLSLSQSINISVHADAAERFTKIGTFFIDPLSPPVLTFSSSTSPITVEGILLKKTNLHQPMSAMLPPFAERTTIQRSDLPVVTADIYLAVKEGASIPSLLPVTFNGESYQVKATGKNTYLLPGVILGRTETLILPPQTREALAGIFVVPTSLSSRHTTFSGESTGGKPEKMTWNFTVKTSGPYVLALDWAQKQWIKIALRESRTGKEILSFGHQQQYPKRSPEPLRVAQLSAGMFYQLELDPLTSTAAQWQQPPVLSIEPIDASNYLFASETSPTSARLVTFPSIGIYDAWVRGTGSSVNLLSSLLHRKGATITLPLRQSNTFTYAGKYFLFSAYDLQAFGARELLIRPSVEEDVYHIKSTVRDGTLTVDLGFLPPGQWSALFGTLNTSDYATQPSAVIHHTNGNLREQTLPLASVSYSLFSTQSFRHQGAATLQVSGLPNEIQDIWLYEEIPNLQPSWSFTLVRGIFGPAVPDIPSLFPFRNIVSSGSLLAQYFSTPGLPPIARNTLGITLVAEPSHDFAPVPAGEIESHKTADGARALSYQYYYWLKYLVPSLRSIGNCDSVRDPSCTMKRVSPLFGMFPGSEDLFPLTPYFREGRRAKTLDRMTESDLMLAMQDCTKQPEICSPDRCESRVLSDRYCILKKQDAPLPADAIAAVHYGIDLHAYYNQEEYFAKDGVADFVRFFKDKGLLAGLSSPLQQFISFVRPSSFKMGALLPDKAKNLLVVSGNAGTTQIANGAVRTHVNEMAVGRAAGFLLAYCLQNDASPALLRNEPLKMHAFQHALIERDAVLYPIRDMNADPVLRKAVQHLVVDGLLTPAFVPFAPMSIYHAFQYIVNADKSLSEADNALMRQIWKDDQTVSAITPKTVLSLFPDASALKDTDRQSLLSALKFNEKTFGPWTRAHLFRTIYLAKGKGLQWY